MTTIMVVNWGIKKNILRRGYRGSFYTARLVMIANNFSKVEIKRFLFLRIKKNLQEILWKICDSYK